MGRIVWGREDESETEAERMGYERWRVLELGDQATSSHLNDEASLSAAVQSERKQLTRPYH